MAGQEGLGAVLGAGAGTAWNGAIAPMVNAGRVAGQNASRMGLAKALTGEPGQALADALSRRATAKAVAPLISERTKNLAKVLALQGVAALPQVPAFQGRQ